MALFGLSGLINRASRSAIGELTGIGRVAAGASRAYRGAIYGAGVAYGAADPFLNSASALALRGVMGLGAAKAISDYSEGNFASPATQGLASIASFGLQWSSYKNFARAGSRLGASYLRGLEVEKYRDDTRTLYRDARKRNLPITDAEFAASRARLRAGTAYGNAYRIPYAGSMPGAPMGVRSGTNYNFYGEMASALELGGSVDRFLAAAGPLAVTRRAAGLANRYGGAPIEWAGRSFVGALGGTVTGRLGYANAIRRAVFAPTRTYADVGRNWMNLFGDLGAIRHPYAPMIVGGAAMGLGGAWLERRTPFSPGDTYGAPSGSFYAPWTWDQRSMRPVAVGGHPGPVHEDMFGMGIQPGGGSAVTSQDVMDGQLAVTRKMVTNRRI